MKFVDFTDRDSISLCTVDYSVHNVHFEQFS